MSRNRGTAGHPTLLLYTSASVSDLVPLRLAQPPLVPDKKSETRRTSWLPRPLTATAKSQAPTWPCGLGVLRVRFYPCSWNLKEQAGVTSPRLHCSISSTLSCLEVTVPSPLLAPNRMIGWETNVKQAGKALVCPQGDSQMTKESWHPCLGGGGARVLRNPDRTCWSPLQRRTEIAWQQWPCPEPRLSGGQQSQSFSVMGKVTFSQAI